MYVLSNSLKNKPIHIFVRAKYMLPISVLNVLWFSYYLAFLYVSQSVHINPGAFPIQITKIRSKQNKVKINYRLIHHTSLMNLALGFKLLLKRDIFYFWLTLRKKSSSFFVSMYIKTISIFIEMLLEMLPNIPSWSKYQSD